MTSRATDLGTKADECLVPLIDCLRTSFKFISIPVATAEDANLFFESLNARGKDLAVSDLVKNRLYFEAGGQVDLAQNLWETMENEMIGRPLPEYLRHFWIAKRADLKSLNVREKGLYRAYSQEVGGKPAPALSLLTDLSTSSRDYVSISDYGLWPDSNAYDARLEQSINDLRLFRVSQTNPLLLNAIQQFKDP